MLNSASCQTDIHSRKTESFIAIPCLICYEYVNHRPWASNLQLLTFAPIAQLDRVTDYESVGRVFESPWAHQQYQALRGNLFVLFSF